jgi:DinB family protein
MRPASTEYASSFGRYVALVPEDDIVSAMREQAGEWRSRLAALTEAQGHFRYASGKWSVCEMVGHIIDCERIFGYRALCLARGEQKALPGFEQDDYAAVAGHDQVPLSELAHELLELRASHTRMFEHMTGDAWRRIGVVNGHPTSARAMAYVIVGHARHHATVLSEQYRL